MRTRRPAHGSRPAARLVAATLLALVVLALAAGPAAAVTAAEVAAKLRESPVYRDSDAEANISVNQVRDHVSESGTPIYIAILPASARDGYGGSVTELGRAISNELRRNGSYMIISGDQYAAANFGGAISNDQAKALAAQAVDDHRNDPQAAVLQWVDQVGAAARGEPVAQSDGGGGGAGGVIGTVAVLTVLAVGGGALIFGMRRRRREREARRLRELEEVKSVANEDLVALGDDIRALDLDTSMPDANPEAVRHYTEAVDQYQKAATALDRTRRVEDLAPMSAALEAGRFSMASAKAALEGRPLPERRPPCFFDPRHGPSVEDVQWAPPDGAPRMVPACAADAQRIHDGLEPQSRQVLAGAGGRMTPYWNAPGYYGPWAGGYFGGYPMSGLFTGLLIGSFLGGGWGYPVYADGGGDGGGDGGDTGGGDWGGGDWGGGDFGGGDFGGGDFGG
jgi:hypothetical protein